MVGKLYCSGCSLQFFYSVCPGWKGLVECPWCKKMQAIRVK